MIFRSNFHGFIRKRIGRKKKMEGHFHYHAKEKYEYKIGKLKNEKKYLIVINSFFSLFDIWKGKKILLINLLFLSEEKIL